MREIVLDTETTGFDPNKGDRIVEVGCVELMNHLPTGRELHIYINPERDVPLEAQKVHGLTDEFLADKPVFADIADDIIAFLEDSPLIAHNATFDMRFLNAEFEKVGRPRLDSARVIDTLKIAQAKFPGAPANLDALCRRFNVDASAREKHGALIDSYLLAEVYLELIGGRAPGLDFGQGQTRGAGRGATVAIERPFREPRPHAPSPAEDEAHRAFLAQNGSSWLWYGGEKTG
ncbi:DNA polymerase III subunit epsilon [Phaeovibrio sulfidiphilus]|uniref:DNA polymerase III subunit epsilon n=1 Tax=Phaeovibrio sulfidiphilus TaxID=1220600 RepID=A0A8J6YL77_9PROT|nr:DNA polymerase III subunit epsilon [Phaeovibrio sulfidiphilus]MBE1236598.1 DNA polymerase III subunit epsilon [Phaeovibrio sulfidiphilus]